jgi:uncharacterized protein YukE
MGFSVEINLTQISRQAKQLRDQSSSLRNVRALLLQYQDNLRAHWKGGDRRPIDDTINDHIERLTALAADLESISSSIISEAETINRAKEWS